MINSDSRFAFTIVEPFYLRLADGPKFKITFDTLVLGLGFVKFVMIG